MTGSPPFQIKRAGKFERSLKKILRKHYRKNRTGEEEFHALLVSAHSALQGSPALPGAKPEPWPGSSHQAGWELWKLRFHMPRLEGAVRFGRLVYLVHRAKSLIVLVWIYTHDEFKGRPPDKPFARLLRELMKRT